MPPSVRSGTPSEYDPAWARTVNWFKFFPQARSSVRMGLEFVDYKNLLFQRGPEQVLLLAQAGSAHLLTDLPCSARVTRKAITWFLVRTAMFHHLRIKIWYAAAPSPGTTTYQKFLWIAISNRQSYQKVNPRSRLYCLTTQNFPEYSPPIYATLTPKPTTWSPDNKPQVGPVLPV